MFTFKAAGDSWTVWFVVMPFYFVFLAFKAVVLSVKRRFGMASNSLSNKKTTREVSDFFQTILQLYDKPVYYDYLRGYISNSTPEIKAYVKKYCQGEDLLSFFKKRKVLFNVTLDNCVKLKQKEKKTKIVISSDDDEPKTVTTLEERKPKKRQGVQFPKPKNPNKVIPPSCTLIYHKTNTQTSLHHLSPASVNSSFGDESSSPVQKTWSTSAGKQQPIVDDAECKEVALQYFRDYFSSNSNPYLQLVYSNLPWKVKSYLKLKYTSNKIHRFLLDHCNIFSLDDDGCVTIIDKMEYDKPLSASISNSRTQISEEANNEYNENDLAPVGKADIAFTDGPLSTSVSDSQAQMSEEDNNDYSENNLVLEEKTDIISADELLSTSVSDSQAQMSEEDNNECSDYYLAPAEKVDTVATDEPLSTSISDSQAQISEEDNGEYNESDLVPEENVDIVSTDEYHDRPSHADGMCMVNLNDLDSFFEEAEDRDLKSPLFDMHTGESLPEVGTKVTELSSEHHNSSDKENYAKQKLLKNAEMGIVDGKESSNDQQLLDSHEILSNHQDTVSKECKYVDCSPENTVQICAFVIGNKVDDSFTINDIGVSRNADDETMSFIQDCQCSHESNKKHDNDLSGGDYSLSPSQHEKKSYKKCGSSTINLQTPSMTDDWTLEQDFDLPDELFTLAYFIKVIENRRNTPILIERIRGHLSQAPPNVSYYIKHNFKGQNFKKFFTTCPKIFIVQKKQVTLSKKYVSEFEKMKEHAQLNSLIQDAEKKVSEKVENSLVAPRKILSCETEVEELGKDELIGNRKDSHELLLPTMICADSKSETSAGVNTSVSFNPSTSKVNTEVMPDLHYIEQAQVQQTVAHNTTCNQESNIKKAEVPIPGPVMSPIEVDPQELNSSSDDIKVVSYEENGELDIHWAKTNRELVIDEVIQSNTNSDVHDVIQSNVNHTNIYEHKNSIAGYEHYEASEESQIAKSGVLKTELETEIEDTINVLPNNRSLLNGLSHVNGFSKIDDTSYEHSMMKHKAVKTCSFSQKGSSIISDLCTNHDIDVNGSIVELCDSDEDPQEVIENSNSCDNDYAWQGIVPQINCSERDDQKHLIEDKESVIHNFPFQFAKNVDGASIIATIYDQDYEIFEQDKILKDFPTYFARFICTYGKVDGEENNVEIEKFSEMLENSDGTIINKVKDNLLNLDAENQYSIKEDDARKSPEREGIKKSNTSIENYVIGVDGQIDLSTLNISKTITSGTECINISPNKLGNYPSCDSGDENSSAKKSRTYETDASKSSSYEADTNTISKDTVIEDDVINSKYPTDEDDVLKKHAIIGGFIISENLAKTDGNNISMPESMITEGDATILGQKFDEGTDTVSVALIKKTNLPVSEHLISDTNSVNSKFILKEDATITENQTKENPVFKNVSKDMNILISGMKDFVSNNTVSKDLIKQDDIKANSVIISEAQMDADNVILKNQTENSGKISNGLMEKEDTTASQIEMKESSAATALNIQIEDDEANHAAGLLKPLTPDGVLSSDAEYHSLSPSSWIHSSTSDNEEEVERNPCTVSCDNPFNYVKDCKEIIRCYDVDVKSLNNEIPNPALKILLPEGTDMSNSSPESNSEDDLGLVGSSNEVENSKQNTNRHFRHHSRIHSFKASSQSSTINDEMGHLEESGGRSALSTESQEKVDSSALDTMMSSPTGELFPVTANGKRGSLSNNQKTACHSTYSQRKDDLVCLNKLDFLSSQQVEIFYGYVILLTKNVCIAKSIENGLPIFCPSDFFKCHKHNTGIDACFSALVIGDMVCCSVMSPSSGTHIMTCCQFTKADNNGENDVSHDQRPQETSNALVQTGSVACCPCDRLRNTSCQTISTGDIYFKKCLSHDSQM